MNSKVTVILIAYHGDQWLPKCLETLVAASHDRLHLVLVDNDGNSIIQDLDLSPFDAEVLSTPRAMGFAEANNFGMVNASHLEEYVLFLNQDTVSTPGWIDICLQTIEPDEFIAALTPSTKDYLLEEWERYYLECARKSDQFQLDMKTDEGLSGFYETPVIPAAAMIVRKKALLESGPFDPIYGSYYEDYDLCYRLKQNGGKIGVCADATIGHYSGSATNSKAAERKRARWITRNKVIYEARTTSDSRWKFLLRYFVLVFPRNLARSLFKRPGSKPLTAFLQANLALLALSSRLLSKTCDAAEWDDYLDSIGWNESGAFDCK